MKIPSPCAASLIFLCAVGSTLANGGAWQVGVPSTGNAAPSDQKRSTEVTIEEEDLTIDLHQELAAIEVRYRMKNTGPKVMQDFFFPVELWTAQEGGESDNSAEKPADLEGYRITADKAELKWKNVASGEKPAAVKDEHWGEFPPATKLWKKSEIPFTANQTREIVIRYQVGYSGSDGSVSDDGHTSDHLLVYSLSPATTWKGKITKGKVTVNVLLPMPEEVQIVTPKNRFLKVSDSRYEWSFSELEPTLDDDLKIIAHPVQDTYPANSVSAEGEEQPIREYAIEGSHYFLVHSDFDAVASSTLPVSGGKNYEVKNVKDYEPDTAWAEGAKDDGVDESITLEVKRPLPLAAILIMPGYRSGENPSLWKKNNRVAELEITLNGEHTFTAKIPDENFNDLYPLPVRDYDQPVKTVKLVIKGVHRGTAARDTCISALRLKGKLTEKPEIKPAR